MSTRQLNFTKLPHILWPADIFPHVLYTSVLTYPSLVAYGYCRSQSTNSGLEDLQSSRRKGHYWNSFQRRGLSAAADARPHTHSCVPPKSGDCRRSRWGCLHRAAKERFRNTLGRREGSRTEEIKVQQNKLCSLSGFGSWFGCLFLLWFVNASLKRRLINHLR